MGGTRKKVVKDFTGFLFGRLEVISEGIPKYDKTRKRRRRRLFCRCKCGIEKSIPLESLVGKLTLSCGCLNKERIRIAREKEGQLIEVGSVWGKFTILKKVSPILTKSGIRKGRANRAYLCKCECGTEKVVAGSILLNNIKGTHNCGCSRPLRAPTLESGEKFGDWEVIEDSGFNEVYVKTHIRKRTTLCKCSCGKEVDVPRGNLVRGITLGCGHWYNASRAEKEIASYLESSLSQTNLILNSRILLGTSSKKEIDIFLPEHKLGIELDGNYYHSEKFKRNKKHHYEKRELALKEGIRLIFIQSDEWEHKSPIVKSMLKHSLKCSDIVFYARQLHIDSPSSQETLEFQNTNHLMGSYKAARSVGLYTSTKKLVLLMSYRLLNDNTLMDITRLCSILESSIVGGFSKLLKYTVESHKTVNSIQSFVDLRYATGNSLLKMGFKNEGVTLGWKWTDGAHTYNRLKCRANMDSRKLSEKEHAQELKWYKLYDAGQAKFVKQL